MAGHVGVASADEFLGEAEHGAAEGRGGGEGFVVHEELGGGAGDEEFDGVVDDEGVGAVFAALDELLEDPRLLLGDGDRGDVAVCFADGPLGQERHVAPRCIVHADALHDVLLLGSGALVEHFVHGGSAGHVVRLWGREAKALGLSDECVLLV